MTIHNVLVAYLCFLRVSALETMIMVTFVVALAKETDKWQFVEINLG